MPPSLPGNQGLSPLVRGKPGSRHLIDQIAGSIPACAGETNGFPFLADLPTVYPRLCGGNWFR